jgi:hypothetical protein
MRLRTFLLFNSAAILHRRPRSTRKPQRAKRASASPSPSAAQDAVQYPEDPCEFASRFLHFELDEIQAAILRNPSRRVILNCTRQWGKSTLAAIKALHHALRNPGSLSCVACPSARQSAELIRKIARFAAMLGIPRRGDGSNDISLVFPNGSRIVGLPGRDSTVRGFSSVSLLIVDEASYVPEEIYHALRPMLATVPDNQIWLISTPGERQGFFFDTWLSAGKEWTKIAVPGDQCKRIPAEFLAEERRRMPEHKFRKEYLCEFVDSEDAVFPSDLVRAAIAPIPHLQFFPWQDAVQAPLIRDPDLRRELEVLCNQFPKPPSDRTFLFGLDLGQSQDPSALVILERSRIVCGPRNPASYAYPTRLRWAVRYIRRFPLGTPYTGVVDAVAELLRHPSIDAPATLTLDATGLGAPVVDMFKSALKHLPTARPPRLRSVTITSGDSVSKDGNSFRVPRTDLIAALEVKLQSRDLLIGDSVHDAPKLVEELCAFKRKPSTSSRTPDDLVFATALALWSPDP